MNHIRLLTTVLVFSALAGSFLHSELGVWDYDNANHSRHDFCELVKATATTQKLVKPEAVRNLAAAELLRIDVVPPTRNAPVALLGPTPGATGENLHLTHRVLLI
jgi:hypothetical protein